MTILVLLLFLFAVQKFAYDPSFLNEYDSDNSPAGKIENPNSSVPSNPFQP